MGVQRYLQPLDRQQALALLADTPVGRVAFVSRDLPTIRPVNHAVVEGDLIIRSHVGAALVEAVKPGRVPVAYEVDNLTSADRQGWSVVVRGLASLVLDEDALARYERLVDPWIDQAKNQVIRVEVQAVSGYSLVP
jgi:nitroimidazol reductase NimA-like FMN-containing flavoprotein (pyridoxamine 5'-phosphate oxidase superfamily)